MMALRRGAASLQVLRTVRAWSLALLQPFPLVALRHVPRYVLDFLRFRRSGSVLPLSVWESHPCFGDRSAKTPFDPHYFFQGAWLARRIVLQNPTSHVDVASSVLTVSVLSGFVPTKFVDYRPLAVDLAGLDCVQGDLNHLPFESCSIDSLSCLHVIEHVGLGRYGDELDPRGHERAASELQRILASGGRLYLSTPVGRERVCFNAHRVFHPQTILSLFGTLSLIEFSFVGDDGRLHEQQSLSGADDQEYGCGLFVFKKH